MSCWAREASGEHLVQPALPEEMRGKQLRGRWPIPVCDSGSSWPLPLHRGHGVGPARFASPRAGARCVNFSWPSRRIVAFPALHTAVPVPSALAGHSRHTRPLPHVSEAPGHEDCE